ncbi:molybdopterin-binding protein [Enterocloster clostridioformis]|uniref:molybdopterin-binding protein n=1 Tax=Enterocloster clostridioformis TaxID=1531 RepID=UPI001C3D4788|nr:molybdopterin-binding protein [Enterocloster clostridioformis]
MKLIQTVDAEGTVLCHDITQIIKGVTKDAVFRKGHVVTREDIPVLLSVGKDLLYVWEKEDGMLHENDAAEILCDMCKGQNMERSQAKEGKIELTAACDGLLKVDNRGLKAVNGFGQMMIATRHGNFAVKKGDKLAGTRIIPLVIEEEKMEAAKGAAAEATGGCPILELKPFLHKKAGIVTTGNEVFYGRIQDTFTPVIRGKLSEFDTEVIDHVTWNDDDTKVTASILDMIQKGADVVVCTGGMSVDPDDKTPLAIRNTGADIVSYGAPVLPGAMFLLAYYQVRDGENPRTVAIMGLPGCVMYAKRTIFDLVLPRIMADDQVTADDLAALGQGGLCFNCPECTFPNCGFGKGM